ncbi:TPA: cysteine-rich KTR domain-containing protein [Streptococcus agalactiae]
MNYKWILCPVCGNKTRLKIREDTELKKFPLYCPKCRQENLIEIKYSHQNILCIYQTGKILKNK